MFHNTESMYLKEIQNNVICFEKKAKVMSKVIYINILIMKYVDDYVPC